MRKKTEYPKSSLDPKIFAVMLGICALFTISLANVAYMNSVQDIKKNNTVIAYELEIIAKNIFLESVKASLGVNESFVSLRNLITSFDDNVLKLKRNKLNEQWQRYKAELNVILAKEDSILRLKETALGLSAALIKAENEYDTIQKLLIAQTIPLDQIVLAGKQMLAIEKIQRNIDFALRKELDATDPEDPLTFARDFKLFFKVLSSMIEGNETLQISPVKLLPVRERLISLQDSLDYSAQQVDQLIRNTPEYLELRASLGKLRVNKIDFLGAINLLKNEVVEEDSHSIMNQENGLVIGVLAVLLLLFLIRWMRQNMRKIRKFLEEKDTINKQENERFLADLRKMNGATNAINAMAISIEHVSNNAVESAQVADKSVNLAKNGVHALQNNMSGMERIRVQIQETSKQIKRLGESSQEIGDTVSLIDDITEQTNILALNAAIQAAMAGEAGRGFAVVAEEVQRLAERSGSATKQIETLVRTIQKETNETVRSMEQTMSEVIQGTRLSQEAGVALEEIEIVSKHLSDLIQKISLAAIEQAHSSNEISQTMKIVQDITAKTAAGIA